MDVKNECRIDYKYRLSSQSPVINKTICSNVVSTQIIKNSIEVTKYVNKESTFSFDILIYTVIIKNTSTLDLNNVLFQDNIPSNTKFIENSFTVNKIKSRCTNPQKGYIIDCLKSCEQIEIGFKVLVLPYNMCNEIMNFSTISYGHIYNVEKPPIVINLNSNKVTSKLESNKIFKQILVNKYINTYDDINFIKNCEYDIDIIKTKIINNLNNNLSTLVVLGKVSFKILYESDNCHTCNDECIEDVFGFSTYIIVPIGINLVHKKNIKYNIEDRCIEIRGKNIIFMNLTLLLYY